MLEDRLRAWLETPQGQRLRARLEQLRPHAERALGAARELPPRDWAGIAVAALAFLFVLQLSRLMGRQTRLLERQTEVLEAQWAATATERENARQAARARLRASLWRVNDLLMPAALKDAAALPPDRRGAGIREARLVLEEGELNPALLEDAESATAWRSALAGARLAEETAGRSEADAGFFLMQAERVRSDVMTVRARLAPESAEPAAPVVPVQAPSPAPTAPALPESSPLPRPTAAMKK